MTTERKDSGVKWVGTIPANWEINKIKYISTLKGRIGWQGLTSEEYTNEGAYLITGTDFEKGSINWDTCVHVPMRRWCVLLSCAYVFASFTGFGASSCGAGSSPSISAYSTRYSFMRLIS